jgi:homoaconitate hydratase
MAKVVFENYDPDFAGRVQSGDVIVGGWNFGTGSSREQAVTSLAAKGIAMVVAGSYSQTYLRNAFNNGFPCVACPELVGRVRELMARQVEAGEKTIIPGDEIDVDFRTGKITFRKIEFRFPPLGTVPQALVVAGGVENQVRERLGLS